MRDSRPTRCESAVSRVTLFQRRSSVVKSWVAHPWGLNFPDRAPRFQSPREVKKWQTHFVTRFRHKNTKRGRASTCLSRERGAER